MSAVTLAYARAHLNELVRRVEAGEETIITRRGRPIARLVPVAMPKKTPHPLADFRATLPKARKSSIDRVDSQAA